MGGFGSGRYTFCSTKSTVEKCLTIAMKDLKRMGILQAGIHKKGALEWTCWRGDSDSISYELNTLPGESGTLRVSYSTSSYVSEEKHSEDYPIELTTTRPHFGGLRWWFICPLIVNGIACNRRVATIHLPPRSHLFGCRHCHDLTYKSCQESHQYDSLFRQLGTGMTPRELEKLLKGKW